ncbi:MAG: glycerate-2-kinase family protein, partial [Nitrososphaeraceae archaeon]|nr:glycerate-2-kinase family protein [Nitrososphaeraceae archaeon]
MDTIQNKEDLLKYHGKYKSFRICLCALEEALKSVDPYLLIKKSITIEKQFSNKKKFAEDINCRISNNNILKIKDVKKTSVSFDLNQFNSIHIVGAGKATAKMAIALEEILSKNKYEIDSGAINIPYDEKIKPNFLKVNEASHPVPDKNSVKGTKTILDLLKNIKGRAIVFGLISGGASSLLCAPTIGLDLRSKQEITKLLLKSGASIHEINKVRKHLSRVKGGNLVRNINPGTIFVTLILSDVVGDDLNIIGSGPTVGDNSTYNDAIKILKKYRIWEILDIKRMKKVKNVLEMGTTGGIQELPRPGDAIFNNVYNILIGNNELACK